MEFIKHNGLYSNIYYIEKNEGVIFSIDESFNGDIEVVIENPNSAITVRGFDSIDEAKEFCKKNYNKIHKSGNVKDMLLYK